MAISALEISASRLERIEQAQALFRHALELRVWLRHRQAGVASEPLDRFREAQALGLHDEAENVAVLAGGEAVIEALLVVDREGRRLLLVEGRQPLPFAAGALQRHAARDDRRHRQPRANFIEERIGEFHWFE